MTLKNPPVRANRRALKALFVKVPAATWDYLFDTERGNGLHNHRVKGPNSLAFYNVSGVALWLCEMGYYTPIDFSKGTETRSHWSGLVTRTHALAG